jgi:hypothetical protein
VFGIKVSEIDLRRNASPTIPHDAVTVGLGVGLGEALIVAALPLALPGGGHRRHHGGELTTGGTVSGEPSSASTVGVLDTGANVDLVVGSVV